MVKFIIKSANYDIPLASNADAAYNLIMRHDEMSFNSNISWEPSVDKETGDVTIQQVVPETTPPTNYTEIEDIRSFMLADDGTTPHNTIKFDGLLGMVDELVIDSNINILMSISKLIRKNFVIHNKSSCVVQIVLGNMEEIPGEGQSMLTIRNEGTGFLRVLGWVDTLFLEESPFGATLSLDSMEWTNKLIRTRRCRSPPSDTTVVDFFVQERIRRRIVGVTSLHDLLNQFEIIINMPHIPNAAERERDEEVKNIKVPKSRKRVQRPEEEEESSSSSSSSPSKEKRMCIIRMCDDNEADARILPCKCEVACLSCLEDYRKNHGNGYRCPSCRKFIEKVEDIHACDEN
jgi:hypothetical protein